MSRQKIRKGTIFTSFLLFPITIFYLSPILIIEGAKDGIVVGCTIIFSLQLLVSLFLGRTFCGWICPASGLQEALFMVQDKRAAGKKYDWIKYFLWVPWISIIIIFFIKAGGIRSVEPFLKIEQGISVTQPFHYIVFYGFVALILILALVTGRRGFCHYVCWMAPFMVIGTKIRETCKWPALHLESDKERCTSCMLCTNNCPMSLDVMRMVEKGSMQNSECILCGMCVDVCTEGVIKYAIRARK